MNLYYFAKGLHVIGFVSWFAGILYLVRLFIYHAEADQLKTPEEAAILKPQYELMERRLYGIITVPAMILTWIGGLMMITLGYLDDSVINWLTTGGIWLHVKLVFVFILSAYTLYCKTMLQNLAAGTSSLTSQQFRFWNEVPTIFLAAIVFLAVFKSMLNFGYAFGGLVIFGILLGVGVKVYKQAREKAGE